MDKSLPPPQFFDRRFDRQHHDRVMWTALVDGYSPEQADVALPLWDAVGASRPVELYGYSYPQAEHWMTNPGTADSSVAVFDFPCRLNIWQSESNFGQPYFSLQDRAPGWTRLEIEEARLTVSCELLPQDLQSPYPQLAKDRSLAMLSLLKRTFTCNERRMNGGTASTFWRSMSNEQSYFVLETHPVFQRSIDSAQRQDTDALSRSLAALRDPNHRFSQPTFKDFVLNPPPIYDEFSNLVLPNDYENVFKNGDIVTIRCAMCVVSQGNHRQYKHRLLQMHRMPSSQD